MMNTTNNKFVTDTIMRVLATSDEPLTASQLFSKCFLLEEEFYDYFNSMQAFCAFLFRNATLSNQIIRNEVNGRVYYENLETQRRAF